MFIHIKVKLKKHYQKSICSLTDALNEWSHKGSNLGPSDYESDALTN